MKYLMVNFLKKETHNVKLYILENVAFQQEL